MTLKRQIERVGVYTSLQQLTAIGYRSIEVSQVPMTPATVAEFTRARDTLGVDIVALSATVTGPSGVNDPIDTQYTKIVRDCRTLNVRHVRIGMMPVNAMRTREGFDTMCRQVDEQSRRFADDGIQLHYHNHHLEFAKLEGRRLLDLIRLRAPELRFEIDVHWVQRGGADPASVIGDFAGKLDLVHLKDYRIGTLPDGALLARSTGDRATWQRAWSGLVEFAEIGEGNLNWRSIIDGATAAGAQHLLVEQDDTYGKDPIACLETSRANLIDLGLADCF